jgi:DNA-binding CsgD family transcriptional regulator
VAPTYAKAEIFNKFTNHRMIALECTMSPKHKMSQLSLYSQHLANLLPKIGSDAFWPSLLALLNSMARIDETSVIVYQNSRLPVYDFAVPDYSTHPNIEAFLSGAFLLDPYYLAATRHGKYGFFRLRDLVPRGFRKSEYFRIYYGGSGLKDECGYLIELKDGGFYNIALGRMGEKAFAGAELESLSDIAPFICAVCQAHSLALGAAQGPDTNFREPLETALACFGSTQLTKREGEVINLILLGHTSRTIAEHLQISPETVKLHRKHAYSKLEIKSQSELFYLFIDSLMSAKGYKGGDPLLAYRRNGIRDES